MEGTYNDIADIIEWYRELPSDYNDIEEVIYKRKLLATYSFRFAVEVGDARKDWKSAEARYESIKNQKRISFSTKHGTTKGDWLARGNCEEELNLSNNFESIFWKMHYIFGATKEVLGEMNQRISYLRDEEKQEKFYNSGN